MLPLRGVAWSVRTTSRTHHIEMSPACQCHFGDAYPLGGRYHNAGYCASPAPLGRKLKSVVGGRQVGPEPKGMGKCRLGSIPRVSIVAAAGRPIAFAIYFRNETDATRNRSPASPRSGRSVDPFRLASNRHFLQHRPQVRPRRQRRQSHGRSARAALPRIARPTPHIPLTYYTKRDFRETGGLALYTYRVRDNL